MEAAFALPPGMLAREAFDGVRELAGDEDEPLVLARRVSADGRGRALGLRPRHDARGAGGGGRGARRRSSRSTRPAR